MIPVMASEQNVKRYLAYWFQLGKRVVTRNGQSVLQPQQVLAGNRYSEEFESIWQQILSPDSGDCYLEGTNETIAELLTPEWDVESCARCEMPIPVRKIGMPPSCCPCFDIASWPNTNLPKPREPICTQERLSMIRDRLHSTENRQVPGGNLSTSANTDSPEPHESTDEQEHLKKIHDRLSRASH